MRISREMGFFMAITWHKNQQLKEGGQQESLFMQKKGTEQIETSRFDSDTEHFTTAAYSIQGHRLVVGAVYGIASNSDRESKEVFELCNHKIRDLKFIHNTDTDTITR